MSDPIDPRPDLTADWVRWTRLLKLAKEQDDLAYGLLDLARCEGAELQLSEERLVLVRGQVPREGLRDDGTTFDPWKDDYLRWLKAQETTIKRLLTEAR